MIRVALDWETAYGKHPHSGFNYTLSSMTTEEYVRHKLFKAHGLGVKIGTERAFYLYKPDDLLHFLKTHPWAQSWVIAHHAQFDGAILSWRAGIRPAFWGCTMSMARAVFPHESASLANISKLLGTGEKGVELANFAGKWLLTDAEQRVLGSYCLNDVELTAANFDAMKGHFPVGELRLIDWTIRCFTEPALQVDPVPLVAAYKQERRTKRALLKQASADKSVLASNDQFAALLLGLGVDPPKKLSPAKVKDGRVDPDNAGDPPRGSLPSFTTKGVKDPAERARLKAEGNAYPWAYAFGKSDEEFKLLLEHPDPQVQAVVEARLGIKSTIKETRSKRFYKIGKRGRFPVYLNYYGAHTNRWSGGDKQNAQNLNRVNPKDITAGALRMSLVAPPGHVVVVRDLGQIEARMLAYVAGQEDLLMLFKTGGDPYNRQASKIFGYEVNRKLDEFFLEGLAGKASTLGCFGSNTKVLTNRGYVSIIAVRDTDMLWDGTEFVHHAGVISQGERQCLTYRGVSATPDHEILTGLGWVEWQEVLTKSSLFRSALNLANLPSSSGETGEVAKGHLGSRGANALVAGKGLFNAKTSKQDDLLDAMLALNALLAECLNIITDMLTLSPMISTASGCLTEFRRASNDATTQKTGSMSTMAGGEYSCLNSGALTADPFYRTLLRSLFGMFHILSLTAKTMTVGMNQEIYGSFRQGLMRRTKVQYGHSESRLSVCAQRMLTYDIALAGPRNRYTILTDCGPVIVHNCGYGMGWGKFQESLRVGFMGMPPLLFGMEASKKIGADIDVFCCGRSYKKGCGTLRDEALAMKPLNVSEEAHLWHCAATKQIVDKYRESNDAIVRLWKEAQNALRYISDGVEVEVGQRGMVTTCADGFRLPNGMKIRYHKLRSTKSGEWKYLSNARKKQWTYIYGGKCVENIVQALSRLVLSDQLLRILPQMKLYRLRAGEEARIVSSTHDELIAVVPERYADACLALMEKEMRTPPPWCADLPLKSSGGYARSYGECDK
jgi:hypothetical protein